MNLDELAEAILQRLAETKPRALLLGEEPKNYHNYNYVKEKPYEAVVLGLLPPGELLHMPNDAVCSALLEGKPVYLSPQKYPTGHAKLLCRELAAAEQHLKQLGVQPLGAEQTLITAEAARRLRAAGAYAPPGSRLTPLAKDILEGTMP